MRTYAPRKTKRGRASTDCCTYRFQRRTKAERCFCSIINTKPTCVRTRIDWRHRSRARHRLFSPLGLQSGRDTSESNAVGSSLQSEPRSLLFAETTVLEQIHWIYCTFCPATSTKRQYMDNMDWHDQYSSISLLCDTSGSAVTSHLSIYGHDSY